MTSLHTSRPGVGEDPGRDHTGAAPLPADPRPDQRVLWGRARLALSILSHRPWCPQCARHARQVEQALNGESIEPIGMGD